MILRFIIKNFLSFDDEMQFDMFPNPKRTSLSNHVYHVANKVPLLKMAAVYGANGAGKSNLLKGINFVKELTTNKSFVDERSIERYFFALKPDARTSPIELTIEFSTKDDKFFIYSVQIGNKGILYETLQLSGLGEGDNAEVFTRQGNEFSAASEISSEVREMIKGWIEKNPFSSLLTINGDDINVITDSDFNDARKWFADDLVFIGLNAINPSLITVFKENKKINKFASDLFKSIDLGISEVKIQTEDFEDFINRHDVRGLPVNRVREAENGLLSQVVDSRNTVTVSIEGGVRKISQMMFEQFGKEGYKMDMDIRAQSDGTVRLLSLIPALYGAVKSGETVIVDELDHSIHPSLVKELVRYFSKHKTKGQLLFTTHQTCLLNQEFIRTDEVWLVEKKEGGSKIYSLNDFKIHNTINIENGFLEGRYGAIPFIGELNM